MKVVIKMDNSVKIKQNMDIDLFRNTYYLKSELVRFCKENDLQASGSKEELTNRILAYLMSGEKIKDNHHRTKKIVIKDITLDTVIEAPFVCSEFHRAFFKKHIGTSFKFNVQFQNWLKQNHGKTYQDAITAYYEIIEYKKNHKSVIGKQFEYNTYIRDFFLENKDKTLEDAITCWKYKKSQIGTNKYEQSDLEILGGK